MQSPTATQNEFGEEVITWATAATVWARVTTKTGDETIEASRASASLTHEIKARTRSDVVPTWRVLWGTRVLEIAAAVPDNAGREMTLICSETV